MIKQLVLIRLTSFFNSHVSVGKTRVGRKGAARASAALVYLILVGCFAIMSASMANLMAELLISLGLEWLYFTIFNVMTFSVVFVFSIFETKGILFECKDNELLLSMPISARDIVFSRIISLLVINYAEAFVLMLPSIVVFAMFGGGLYAVVGGLITTLLIPLIATALAVCIGYLVAAITKMIGKGTISDMISYVLFLVLYFLGYNWLISSMETLEVDPSGFITGATTTFSVIKGIGEASLLKPLPLFLMALVCVSVSAVIFFAVVKGYMRIMTRTDKTKKVKYVKRELKQSSVVVSLSAKEISRFLSSANYIMNGAIGSVIQVAFGVMLVVKGAELSGIIGAIGASFGITLEGALPLLLTTASVTLSTMNYTATSALSLEGKSLWIIGTSPISEKSIAYAKLVPQLMVTLPANIITSVLIAIAVKASITELLFILIVPIIMAIAMAMLSLSINIALPRFEYEHEAQVIKQSMAVFVTMISGMLIGALLVSVAVLVTAEIGALAAEALIVAMVLAIFAAAYLILTGPALVKLKKILSGR